MSILQFCLWVLVGYLLGTLLSDHLHMDLTQTHWANIWVYFWLLLWPLGLAWLLIVSIWKALLVLLLICAIAVAGGITFAWVRGP